MRKLITLLSFMLSVFVVSSCSESASEPEKLPETLQLTANPEQIVADSVSAVTFTVKDMQGNDVTNTCIISVNDKELPEYTFKTKTSGKYLAVAKDINGKVSNTVTISAIAPTAQLQIETTKEKIVADSIDVAVLSLKDEFGVELTSDVVFMVDGNPIPGNEVRIKGVSSSDWMENLHKITATWKGISSSKSISIEACLYDNNYKQEGRLLAEYYTYTGCQYCYMDITVLEEAAKRSSRFIPVAIHSSSSSLYSNFDQNTRNRVNDFVAYYNPTGTPYTCFGRIKSKKMLSNIKVEGALREIPETAPVGIAIQTTLNEDATEISVDAYLISKENYKGKVGAILVENGMEAFQAGMGKIEMKQTMRDYQPSFLGTDVTVNAQTPQPFHVVFKPTKTNLKNCNVIVYVTDANGYVVNVQQVKAGSSIGY